MFEVIYEQWRRWVTPFGGRGSGKSRTVVLIIVLLCVLQKRFIVVARDYKDDVADSIWRNIVERIYELELQSLFKITKERIKCLATGTEIIQFGLLDNPDKIKSLEGCDLLVMEESAKLPRYVWEKVIPTIRENGASIVSIFNPDWEKDETYDYLVTKKEKLELGHFTRLINYLDNYFCPDSIKLEAESMKINEPERYENIYLGVPKDTSDCQIFNGAYEIADFDSENEDYFPMHPNHPRYIGEIEYLFGVALGHSQKPSFVVRGFIHNEALYIDKEYSCIDADIADVAENTFNMPGNDEGVTYCDPRKETTSERFSDALSELGGSSIVADKWTSDTIDSIVFMRNQLRKIIIHPSCLNVIECFDSYFWDIDSKTDEVLDRPIEKHDQAFHAIRFSITNYIQGNRYL
jgi:phage terminase large subunit